MRKILAIIAMTAICISAVQAQDSTKEREKNTQERVDSLAHVMSMGAIMRDHFVLLATEVSVGTMGYVHSGLDKSSNFIVVQGEHAMVQCAMNNVEMGANGLGGLTVSGRVSNKRVTQDNDGNVSVSFHIFGSRVNADVWIELYKDCDYATAMVMAALSSDRISMSGRLLPYKYDDLHFDD